MASTVGRVIVYGGRGALGSVIVSYFKIRNWWVGSIDMAANEEAHANVLIKAESSLLEQELYVQSEIKAALNQEKVDALICVAGGFAAGNVASQDFAKNVDLMSKQSIWTSVITAKLAANHLKENGVVVLTGASAALSGTPGAIAYGMAKAAVHHLVRCLSMTKQSGLPENSTVIAILPITLDTPMNRKFMPKSDFTSWTPLEFVAEKLFNWSSGTDCPKNGSFVELVTKNSETTLKIS